MNKVMQGLIVVLSCLALHTCVGAGIPDAVAPFKTPSENVLFQERALYVFNGTSSVGLNKGELGIHRLVAQPYYAFPFTAKLRLFDMPVKVQRYDWYPSECVYTGEAVRGIETALQIVPLKSSRGSLVNLTLRNATDAAVTVPVKWLIQGDVGKSSYWTFNAEASMGGKFKQKGSAVISVEENVISVARDDARLVAALSGSDSKAEKDSLSRDVIVAAGGEATLSLVVLLGAPDAVSVASAKAIGAQPDKFVNETRAYWSALIEKSKGRLPELTGASPELQAFYRVGLISFLSTRFEVPEFLFNPYHATCGIDGGAACCYVWDFAYGGSTCVLLEPTISRKQLLYFLKLGIKLGHSFDPIRGERMGSDYSYNFYSLSRAVYCYLALTGDTSMLMEDINGKPAYVELYESCLEPENLGQGVKLIDYGGNGNLLELRRTQNYTHVTPSPNAERVLTYRYLTEIYQALGKKTPHDLVKRGEELKAQFSAKLWNNEKQWLNTLDADGSPRMAYSIQIFDVLRTGILSKEQEAGILTHLNEEEFLSKWGVHSLAKTDPGYDPRDVDWGGPGAYSADPCELIVDLSQSGHGKNAVDVLNRILWWGEFPYLPQAMRAGTKGYREDGRSNLISGGATCQAVINGLFGIRFELNQIIIQPINDPMMKGLALKGLTIRGRTFDIVVSDKGETFSVIEQGKPVIVKPLGESIVLALDLAMTQ